MWTKILKKMQGDIAWNLMSFAFQAVAGISVNIFLSHQYGASGVGIFNQSLAVLFVASQLGTFGLHYSVLRFVAEHALHMTLVVSVGATAIASCVLTASIASVATWLLIPTLANYFQGPDMAEALIYTVPALWFFCLNKVLLGFINGLKQMRRFAVLQAGRYLFWFLGAGYLWWEELTPAHIPMLMVVGEVGLFGMLVSTLAVQPVLWRLPTQWLQWTNRHFHFGFRSFLSGSLIEANSRIDILVLGHIFTDRVVGIYSLATLVFEGLSQVGVVLRNQWNPELTKTILASDFESLQASIHRGFRISMRILWPISLLALFTYPFFLKLSLVSNDFMEGWLPFGVLCLGLGLVSGFQPFGMILLQGNYPGRQTLYLAVCAGLNLALNLLLVPYFGMLGAAIGTALSLVLSSFYLRAEVLKLWHVRLTS